MTTAHSTDKPAAVYLIGDCPVRLWSMTQEERFRRAFARTGIATLQREGEPWPASGTVILIRTDYALEEVLTRALAATPDTILAVDAKGTRRAIAAHVPAARAAEVAALLRGDGTWPADLAVQDPATLGSTYNHALRKRAVPYALSLAELPAISVEKRMFHGAYKGVTDFVTKWLWPWPAFWVTRWCAAWGISPNAVTAASFVLVLVALWLFAIGQFGLGVVVAWLMTFLDTVDGKLARVTLTSSKLGNVFDHGIDLLHPPFWYAAWYYGIYALGTDLPPALLSLSLWIVIIGYVLGRLQEGFFIWQFKFELHAWRPVDAAFRLFTARRNPNLALMTLATLAGRPDLGFLAVALWTVLSLAFHFLRIGQALRLRRSGAVLRSWLTEPIAAAP
ncbi:MAG TPA: CDP-alcohol phosphatidyltransferase family protein [Dongiaceae bacterium]|jgi:phosphatidylglycerophosphate synthase|nr:CDP-alcohol phosphatidyltransferase family protein [Dongiaceae bacterium]